MTRSRRLPVAIGVVATTAATLGALDAAEVLLQRWRYRRNLKHQLTRGIHPPGT